MPNHNLPKVPNDPNQAIPNDPFYSENSGKPYLEGPWSPILIGCGIEVCGDFITSPAGEIPIPIGYLSQRGALVTALAPAIPATLLPGTPGQYLSVDDTEPTGLKWVDPPVAVGCISCDVFTAKGQLLTATGASSPVALPAGPDNYVLTSDGSPRGMSWCPNPYPEFTAKGQLVGTADGVTALTIQGTDGDILYYDITTPTGWRGCQGCELYVPQCGFERGYLAVGCGTNASAKLPIGGDGYYLEADSSCALGVKWTNASQQAKQTDGCQTQTTAQAIVQPFCQLPASAFPAGCTVYVALTGSWWSTDRNENRNGCMYLGQGSDCSLPVEFSNEGQGLINSREHKFIFSLSYVFNSWCSGFGCNLYLFVNNVGGGGINLQMQTSAFIVKSN